MVLAVGSWVLDFRAWGSGGGRGEGFGDMEGFRVRGFRTAYTYMGTTLTAVGNDR